MSSQVEPEEVEAILAAVGDPERTPPEVESRDFRQPRRLSAEGLDALRRGFEGAVADVQAGLGTILGEDLPVRFGSVREVPADGLFDDPAYSPNLALDADAFTLARSPRTIAPWRQAAGSLQGDLTGLERST